VNLKIHATLMPEMTDTSEASGGVLKMLLSDPGRNAAERVRQQRVRAEKSFLNVRPPDIAKNERRAADQEMKNKAKGCHRREPKMCPV
jgi:hypothetical protein